MAVALPFASSCIFAGSTVATELPLANVDGMGQTLAREIPHRANRRSACMGCIDAMLAIAELE